MVKTTVEDVIVEHWQDGEFTMNGILKSRTVYKQRNGEFINYNNRRRRIQRAANGRAVFVSETETLSVRVPTQDVKKVTKRGIVLFLKAKKPKQ